VRVESWLSRLRAQLPGWHVWYSSTVPRWNAVPAPADLRHTEVYNLPNFKSLLISTDRPEVLRELCRERYGWYDNCDTCVGSLARECGHRQPERA
jgi:hypothetical protein